MPRGSCWHSRWWSDPDPALACRAFPRLGRLGTSSSCSLILLCFPLFMEAKAALELESRKEGPEALHYNTKQLLETS